MIRGPKCICYILILIELFSVAAFLQGQTLRHTRLYLTINTPKDSTVDWGRLDSLTAMNTLDKWITQQKKQGYLLTRLDSLQTDSVYLKIFAYRGQAYRNLIFTRQDDTAILIQTFYATEQYLRWEEELLKADLENGYPFCKIKIYDEKISGDSLMAKILYVKGPRLTIGPMEQRRGKILDRRYLERITGLKRGQWYNQRKVDELTTRLNALPFVESKYQPLVHYLGKETLIWTYLVKKPANRLDALLGLNSSGSGASRSYRITGEAHIDLSNSFKWGERFQLNYENLQENSPRLGLMVDFPFIPKIPFGFKSQFDLLKYREDYISLFSRTGFSFSIYPRIILGIQVQNSQSYLLNIDTSFIKTNIKLPQSLDFNLNAWGVFFESQTLDKAHTPTKGWTMKTSWNLGQKKFKRNPKILSYDLSDLSLSKQYDSLNKSGLQLNAEWQAEYFWNPLKRQVIRSTLKTFYIYTENQVVNNELYRLGGYKNLRGFDDDIFLSDAYLLSSLEYRFMLNPESFLYIFTDYARMRVLSQNNRLPWNDYWGMGTGIQLKTPAGLFNLAIAVGKSPNAGFDWSSAKVHFGYTSLF